MTGTHPQRAGPGHHPGQAVRQRRRGAAPGAAPGRRPAGAATRSGGSRARWGPSRTCSTCSAATPPGSSELERRVAAHLGFESVLGSVGQVYPRSLDLDVVLGAGPGGRRPGRPGAHHPAHGRPGARHRGVPARPGGVVGDAPQDEQPQLRADRRVPHHPARPPGDGRGPGGRPVERGRRELLGRASGGAARRLPRRRRAVRDLPHGARRLRRLPRRRRAGARPLPALPLDHQGAHGGGPPRRRARGGPRGHQAERGGRGAAAAGGGRRGQRPARPPRRRSPPVARPGRAGRGAGPSARLRGHRAAAGRGLRQPRSRSWWPRTPRQLATVRARSSEPIAGRPTASPAPSPPGGPP